MFGVVADKDSSVDMSEALFWYSVAVLRYLKLFFVESKSKRISSYI